MSDSNSLEAKIVVLGSQGVGKTSLVHRYVKGVSPTNTASTVGASFLTKRVVDIDTGSVVRLQIWDTAGQERFRSISKLYYRGANAAILCYDITEANSFIEMGRWLSELRENLAEDTILHVVGTKADIVAEEPSRRKVPYERSIAYVAENLYPNQTGGANMQPTGGDTPARVPTPKAEMLLAGHGLGPSLSPPSGNPLPSPHSNRSSGLWGQDFAWTWTSCHEVSASTGEGVDEVFRVVTRRLIEQRNQRLELEQAATTPETGTGAGYFESRGSDGNGNGRTQGIYGGANGGSFRVGYGDKRRSWLGLPTFGAGGNEDVAAHPDATEWQNEIQGRQRKRRGRCC
ncbi:ras-domain-containing protein [Rhizodiscina lignyota]|uniref:Ras-domain-containing protein n=1 Tax=Rhizodiscina lignyota TaxID=1504668 RepID=A0A9P4IAT4_9PEZI|nr:ras-domain-containing protein [Rhizodiscina lignyota]